VKLHSPEKSLTAPLQCSKDEITEGLLLVDIVVVGTKVLPHNRFKTTKVGVPGKVATIEYDRNARIALINYQDGENVISLPRGLKVGETVLAAPNASILIGNCLPFQSIPLGTSVHNVELTPGCGGQSKGSWLRSSNCSKRR
jgi:large subunit ribosomal protein L2